MARGRRESSVRGSKSPSPQTSPREERGEGVVSVCASAVMGICPFLVIGPAPYCRHGKESRPSEKARQNSEIESTPPRRAADRAGAGGTAQSRDQSRRCRSWFRHRTAAATG